MLFFFVSSEILEQIWKALSLGFLQKGDPGPVNLIWRDAHQPSAEPAILTCF